MMFYSKNQSLIAKSHVIAPVTERKNCARGHELRNKRGL